jgi:hypothetical protein
MTTKQRIQNIKREIEWYGVRKTIAEAMVECGKLGFEFSGHGAGFGGEDFNLVDNKKNLYINFCDKGRSCEVMICENEIAVFIGTIGKAMKFLHNS